MWKLYLVKIVIDDLFVFFKPNDIAILQSTRNRKYVYKIKLHLSDWQEWKLLFYKRLLTSREQIPEISSHKNQISMHLF